MSTFVLQKIFGVKKIWEKAFAEINFSNWEHCAIWFFLYFVSAEQLSANCLGGGKVSLYLVHADTGATRKKLETFQECFFPQKTNGWIAQKRGLKKCFYEWGFFILDDSRSSIKQLFALNFFGQWLRF